jgi:hypothetical protein
MGSTPEHSPSTQTILQTRRASVVLVCLVAALSYIVPLLQSALMRNLTDGMAALPGLRDFGSGVNVGTDKTLASPHCRVLSLFDLRVGVPVAWFIPADRSKSSSLRPVCDSALVAHLA